MTEVFLRLIPIEAKEIQVKFTNTSRLLSQRYPCQFIYNGYDQTLELLKKRGKYEFTDTAIPDKFRAMLTDLNQTILKYKTANSLQS
jgi:hypothetical protein